MPTTEMLRATEAAVVAGVSLRDVNRSVDEGILPDDLFEVEAGRHFAPLGCVFIAFYFDSAALLTSEERLLTIRQALSHSGNPKWSISPSGKRIRTNVPKGAWTVRHDFLTIDLAPFAQATAGRLARLEAAREMVQVSTDILGGIPVIRGTRVPVYDVAASVSAGISTVDILDAYPSINSDQLELAAVYASANPQRGRPVRSLPPGAMIISQGRLPRSRRAG